VRSDDSIALALLREIEEEGVRQRSKEVLIVAPVEIANYLLNQKREHIAMIESRFGLSVRVEGDSSLISPDYRLERFKTASRIIPPAEGFVPPVIDEEDQDDSVAETEEAAEQTAEKEASGDKPSGKKRRRRRRRGGKGAQNDDGDQNDAAEQNAVGEQGERPNGPEASDEATPAAAEPVEAGADGPATETPANEAPAQETPTPPRRGEGFGEVIDLDEDTSGPAIVEVPESEAPRRPARRQRVSQPVEAVLADVPVTVAEPEEPVMPDLVPPKDEPVAEVEETAEVPETAKVPETAEAEPTQEETRPLEATDPEVEAEADPVPTEPEQPVPAQAAAEEPVLEMSSAGGQSDEPPHPEETAEDEVPSPRRRRGWWSRT
jgi:ribonuclease E